MRPLIHAHFGDLPHAAASVDTGSEVLGFDTDRSADHEWGPRLQLSLHHGELAQDVVTTLSNHLPKTFYGYPTNFAPAENERIRHIEVTDGPVFHRVDVTTLDRSFTNHLGFDPRDVIATLDWLSIPDQPLAEVTAGAVFHGYQARRERAEVRLPAQSSARPSSPPAWSAASRA